MSSFNSSTLIGNLGADPESKTLDSGQTVTNFSLATSRSWKNANGEKQESTQWHNVVLWGKLGELAAQYLSKGSKVLIIGRIEYRESFYEDRKRYYTDIVAQEMKFLSPKPERNDRRRFAEEEESYHPAPLKKPTAADLPGKSEADLPF